MIKRLFCIVLLLACAAVAQVAPQPPRVYIDTTWNPPTGGVTWSAHTSTDLKNALQGAQPGDVIELDAGVIYSGNFQIRAKANPGNKWLYIVSKPFLAPVPPVSAAAHSIFVPGTRVDPTTDAKYMAKLVTTNAPTALTLNPGVSYVRLVGIEMYSTSQQGANPTHKPWPINGQTPVLVMLTTVSNVTIDRCYIHGSDTEDITHAVIANQGASYVSVVDSDIRDIHVGGQDAQAFVVTSSKGPFKLVNNYLSASTEDVMFGGAGVNLPAPYNTYVPSDIEIRNNHFYKPEYWIPHTTGATPWQWVVKNNLEFKSAQRVVVTGNTLENAWNSGQYGVNVDLTVRTYQSGPTAVVDDIDIENNVLKNANWGFSIIGYDDLCQPPGCTNQGESARVLIKNNLLLLRSLASQASYHPFGFSMGHKMRDYVIQHNTVLDIDGSDIVASVFFNQGKCPTLNDQPTNVFILDNVFGKQPSGDCGYGGQNALDKYMPLPASNASRFYGNVMYVPSGEKVAEWPPRNYATTVPITLDGTNQLATPLWTDTTDGAVAGYHPEQNQM